MSKHRKVARKKRRLRSRRWMSIGLGVLGALVVLGTTTMLAGMQVEQHNSFCATCHTQDESKYVQQSLAPAMDLASYHEAKGVALCIDCHSGTGLAGRIGGLVAGASDMISYVSGHYPQPAVQENPIGDGNCLKCHTTVIQAQDINNHFHSLLSQWQAMSPASAATCVSCHTGHNPNGDVQLGYLNQTDTSAICQQCHQVAGVQ